VERIPNWAADDNLDRVGRDRLDDEIARCLAETAPEDVALAAEFADTAADGL